MSFLVPPVGDDPSAGAGQKEDNVALGTPSPTYKVGNSFDNPTFGVTCEGVVKGMLASCVPLWQGPSHTGGARKDLLVQHQ
jgi:hypothetical protein